MTNRFKVHLGGTRYRRFETLEAAQQCCNGYFESSRVVLSIEEYGRWTVLSPDGLPIEPRTYPTESAALAALLAWKRRFTVTPWYHAADGRLIHVTDLMAACRVERA